MPQPAVPWPVVSRPVAAVLPIVTTVAAVVDVPIATKPCPLPVPCDAPGGAVRIVRMNSPKNGCAETPEPVVRVCETPSEMFVPIVVDEPQRGVKMIVGVPVVE